MEMIIGGAFQGKEKYARAHHPRLEWKDGAELTEQELLQAEGVLNFQEYIKKELREGREVTALAEKLHRAAPNVVLVTEEVGYGVVPMDAFDRAYREAVGRVCTELAAYSHTVTRVVCGIGMVIKHA